MADDIVEFEHAAGPMEALAAEVDRLRSANREAANVIEGLRRDLDRERQFYVSASTKLRLATVRIDLLTAAIESLTAAPEEAVAWCASKPAHGTLDWEKIRVGRTKYFDRPLFAHPAPEKAARLRAEAVAAEREACAKIALLYGKGKQGIATSEAIAGAIRARSESSGRTLADAPKNQSEGSP